MKRWIDKVKKNFFYILLGVLCLTPLIWFYKRAGVLINGSDTNFPLDPLVWFLRRLFVWNSFANAGSDFSSSTSGLFFHLIQLIPYTLGLNLQSVQIMSLVFWFSLVILSSYFFARVVFPEKRLAQLLFVVFYSFNIYLFNTWENVKVANLSLVSGIPILLSIFHSLNESKLSKFKGFALSLITGVIVMGSGINPAYFVILFLLLFIFYLSFVLTKWSKKSIKIGGGNLVIVYSSLILSNLFWILPTVNFIFQNVGPYGSIDKIAYTNWIDSLSQNTSILNVMRLQGAWDWYSFDSLTGLPIYIPYALNYFFRLPFLVFSFLVPFLALLALFLRSKTHKELYVFFAALLILGIFLGVGTHLPTGSIFRELLINRLPFFSLFRSPWYIFTPFLTLSYAGLLGLLSLSTNEILKKIKFRFAEATTLVLAIILIVGNLFYTYPLVTGKIFRPAMADNFLIKFPSYVFDSQKWLANLKPTTRIIGYPDDNIERFEWGYNGIDSVLGLIADVEVLFSPLNTPEAPVSQLLREFYESTAKGQVESVKHLAGHLNADYLFFKKDQETFAPEVPEAIKSFDNVKIGEWEFYRFPGTSVSKIFVAENLVYGRPYKYSPQILTTQGANTLLVNPSDSVVAKIPIFNFAGQVVFASSSIREDYNKVLGEKFTLSEHLVNKNESQSLFTFDIPQDGQYTAVLERYKLEDFGLSAKESLTLELNGKSVNWKIAAVDDSFVYFDPYLFGSGTQNIILNVSNKNLVTGGDFEKGVVFKQKFNVDVRTASESGNTYVSIHNKSKENSSVSFKINSFDPFSGYLVKIRYKQIYGSIASLLVNQRKGATLLKSESHGLPSYPEWGVYTFYFKPVATSSDLEVELMAEKIDDALGTKILYDDLEVYKLFTNNLMFIKEPENKIVNAHASYEKVSPVEYKGSVEEGRSPHILVFSENYTPDWIIEMTDKEGKRLNIKPQHFSGNFYANAWYVEEAPQKYNFKIYYRPQIYRNVGIAISIVVTLIITILAVTKKGRLNERFKKFL